MATILYLGTEEGVVTVKSSDGEDWELTAHGLKQWGVSELLVSSEAPNRVFAATRGDGVWLSEDFGGSWKKPSYGKRGPGKVRCLVFAPDHPDTLYAGGEPIDLFITENRGKDWTVINSVRDVDWVKTVTYPVSAVEPHIRDIAVDPGNPANIYIALQVGYMLKSSDHGKTWKLLRNNLDADVHTIVLHPTRPDEIFVATGGHDCRRGNVTGRALYRSNDGGESWLPMAAEFAQEYSVPLAVNPGNPDWMYSALAHGNPGGWKKRQTGAEAVLIRSKDGGRNWQKLDSVVVGYDFPEVIQFDSANPTRMFIALKRGVVCLSEDNGESWRTVGIETTGVADLRVVQT